MLSNLLIAQSLTPLECKNSGMKNISECRRHLRSAKREQIRLTRRGTVPACDLRSRALLNSEDGAGNLPLSGISQDWDGYCPLFVLMQKDGVRLAVAAGSHRSKKIHKGVLSV